MINVFSATLIVVIFFIRVHIVVFNMIVNNFAFLAMDMMMGIGLEITASRSMPTMEPCGPPEDAPSNFVSCNINKSFEKENVDQKEGNGQVEEKSTEKVVGEFKNNQGALRRSFSTYFNSNFDLILDIQCLENPNGMVSNDEDKNVYGNMELPSFDFSSKSLNVTPDVGSSVQDQNVLKQSQRSAFSRYVYYK